MIRQHSLAEIIQSKVHLGPLNPRGFHGVKCQVCNDYQERGAFKFDASSTGFSCWNCSSKFKYEEGSGRLSKNARSILSAFGITNEDLVNIQSRVFSVTKKEDEPEISLTTIKKVKIFTPEVALPDNSFPLGSDGNDELQAPLIEYLLGRKIDPLKIKAHFSLDKRYARRVIIPFYRDGRIIYWQARTIDDVKPRYLNSSISRDAVIYGYDQLYSWKETPLFVTEGVFDAISVNGICLNGSSLNETKIEVLKKSRRRLIFIIDRDKTGGELGKVAIENGWEITFVDERAKDANDSVQQFGLPYTIYCLLKNATSKPAFSDQSQLKLSLGLLLGKLRRTK